MVLNYSKIIARKLILGITALSLTIICLVSTTFAWFAKNQNAWINDFNIKLTGVEGLQLSLDNESWSQDISADELREFIRKKANKESFDQITLGAATISSIDNGNINFVRDKAIEEYDQGTRTYTYKHIDTPVEANTDSGYIKFDLYARSVTPKEEKLPYRFMLTEGTAVTSTPFVAKLGNELYTRDVEVTTDTDNNSVYNYKDSYKKYKSGDNLEVYLSNAVRLGLYKTEYVDDAYEYTDFKVYELSNESDLGSVALESHRGVNDKFDPEVNAMYTYYNKYFPKYPLTQGMDDSKYIQTLSSTDIFNGNLLDATDEQIENVDFGEFRYSDTNKEYNRIKLEVYIWLEGWDADYFVSLTNSVKTQITVDFEFAIQSLETN